MASFLDSPLVSAYVIHQTPEESRYLLIRRSGSYLPGLWQMVTGGVHGSETAWQAALREIYEETGLTPTQFYNGDAVETFYYKEKDKIAFSPVFVAFVDEPHSIVLAADEHDHFEWCSYEEALNRLVWAEWKRILTHVHHTFVLNIPNPILLIETVSE